MDKSIHTSFFLFYRNMGMM